MKKFFIELIQASSFFAVLTFVILSIGGGDIKGDNVIIWRLVVTAGAFLFGGILMMLAKRFIISAIIEIRDKD